MAGIDSFVKWMLHCDGADASNTFTDSSLSPKTQTARGSAQIDTAQSKFGGASGIFNGSTDWVDTPNSADFDFGSGDFTMDLQVRFNSVGECGLLSNGVTGSGGFSFNYDGTNLLLRLPSTDLFSRAWSPSANQWYHVEIDRNGNNWYFFVDGTQVGTTLSSATSIPNSTQVMRAGTGNRNSAGSWSTQIFFNGWLDEIRVSKGIARHTANFTAPTSAYTAVIPFESWFHTMPQPDTSRGLIIV